MLVAFAEVSFPLLSGPTGLIDNPDTIDDIFRLCSRSVNILLPTLSNLIGLYTSSYLFAPVDHVTINIFTAFFSIFSAVLPILLLLFRFIQHVPEKFLGSPVAPASIQCALAASVLDHRDAFSSVMKFFRDLLTLGKNDDLVSPESRRSQGGIWRRKIVCVCVCEEGGEGGEDERES